MKRDRQAFHTWVLARTGPTSDPLVGLWRRGGSCPSLTRLGLERAASRLNATPDEVAMVLVDQDAQSAIAQHRRERLFAQRQASRGDLLDDGTYMRVCDWCARNFVSPYALGTPCCADCFGGNAAYRQRLLRGSRKCKPRTTEQLRRQREQRRAARILPNARASLAKINAALDELEGALVEEQRRAMRKAWRMENHAALQRDRDRRRISARRRVDPNTNRPHELISGLWVPVCQEFGFRCAYCGMTRCEAMSEGFDLQLDHIVPINHAVGIAHRLNAAPACIHCNASKGNRDLIEWAAAKGLAPAPLAVAKYHRLRGIYAA